MEDEFLSSKQAAGYLDISQHQIYKLSAGLKFPTYSPTGGKIYFLKSDLDEWIKSGRKLTIKEVQSQINKSFLKRR
jgi:excisionase family DNA binding protein